MKVLHVITGLGAGGAETQLELFLQHTRHPTEVATLHNFGSVGRRIAARGNTVYDLDMSSNVRVSAVFRLAGIMRRGGFDVVHVHLYRACIYGRIAARLAQVPVVVTTEHSLGEEFIEGRRKSQAIRLLYLATDLLSDLTIAVSSRVRKRLVEWGVSERKIRVIPNGLDFSRFAFNLEARKTVRAELGILPDDFVVGSVGRLHSHKGYDVLIHAAAPLLKSDGARLLLVGEGPEESRLKRLAEEAKVDHRTIFTDERADIPRLLSAMDIFVSSSKEGSETYGIAVLEALAAGLRVVAVDCPVLDGLQVNGVSWTTQDVLQLRRVLLDERTRRACLGMFDEILRQHYDICNIAATIDDLYEALLDSR